MPRPRTPVGSFGQVHVQEVESGLWRARAYYRFPDGRLRQVERIRRGKRPASAVAALKGAMTEAAIPAGGAVRPTMRLNELAELYLESKRRAERAPRTVATYEHNLRSIVLKRLGDLSIAEASAERLQEFLWAVEREHGPGAAKGCRSVLSGMLNIAVRRGAIPSNPTSVLESVRQPRARASVALPLTHVPVFLDIIRSDPELRRLDLPDLFEFMLHTGCRIGEALALRWSKVDLEGAQVTFAATVIRIRGEGLRIQEHGKSDAATRTVALSAAAVRVLGARDRNVELVFPSMLGRLRDTSNTEADWRANRERLGYPALTSHALRKTCATALDVGGLSARAIAEFLGHKRPSMTQDVYMSRNVGSALAAAQLDRIYGVSTESVDA